MKTKNIVVLSRLIENSQYYESAKINNIYIAQQTQKYLHLMVKGMGQEFSGRIYVISNILSGLDNYNFENINVENTFYIYPDKRLSYREFARFALEKIGDIVASGDTQLFVDGLTRLQMINALVARRKYKLSITTLVLDVPMHSCKLNRYQGSFMGFYVQELKYYFDRLMIRKSDSFVFLTKYMGAVLNKHNKPQVIVEGLCPCSNKDDDVIEALNKESVMYAGIVSKQYGIPFLIEGFLDAQIHGLELWIFGDGDYKEEILKYAEENSCIKYYGTVDNATVLKKEREATLLVNPRPSKEEYTKYSFPSKTIEYMASGTPVLTTKLPGIPEEYNDFLFFLENENRVGVCEALKRIFEISKDKRIAFGKSASNFVTEKKNCYIQGKRVISVIEQTNRGEKH